MPDFKPMLAAAVKDTETLTYPMIASPKLDGIRCLKHGPGVVSRKLKLIPNRFIRESLAYLPQGLDGELMVGSNFQDCTSGVMSRDGEPDFTYWVFDWFDSCRPHKTYYQRLLALTDWHERIHRPRVALVPTEQVNNPEELLAFEGACLDAGFEGVCLRDPKGPYKFGRSTLKQGWLLKLKRFVDGEALILGFEEQYLNTNELEKDELGYAKRSKTKAGRVGKDTLGKFLVQDLHGKVKGVKFAIATGEGLTDALRKEIWDNREKYQGKIVKYKSQPFGVKDAPRLPIYLGFRDPIDL